MNVSPADLLHYKFLRVVVRRLTLAGNGRSTFMIAIRSAHAHNIIWNHRLGITGFHQIRRLLRPKYHRLYIKEGSCRCNVTFFFISANLSNDTC